MVVDLVPLQASARYFGKRNVAVIASGIVAAGMPGTASFSRIPDASVSEASAIGPKGFALSAFVWNLALTIAGPFFNVYLESLLGASSAAGRSMPPSSTPPEECSGPALTRAPRAATIGP